MSKFTRMNRESNPPAGQLASPTPQYYDRLTEQAEDVEGEHGAPFAKLLGPNGQPISDSNRLPVADQAVAQALAQLATEGKLEQVRALLAQLDGKVVITAGQTAISQAIAELAGVVATDEGQAAVANALVSLTQATATEATLVALKTLLETGDAKVQLKGHNEYETITTTAITVARSHTFNASQRYVTVRNRSALHPVDISFDAPLSDTNRIRVNPGETKVVRRESALTIHYQATVAAATLDIIGSHMAPEGEGSDSRPMDYAFEHLPGYRVIATRGRMEFLITNAEGKPLWLTNDPSSHQNTWQLLHTFDEPIQDIFVTTSRTMLVWTGVLTGASPSFRLFRRAFTDTSFTELTLPNTYGWFPGSGIDQDTVTGDIIFVEYTTVSAPSLGIFKSSNDGATWVKVFEYTTPLPIRHFHTCDWDPFRAGEWYVTSGDNDTQIKWLRSTDGGGTWNEIEGVNSKDHKTLGLAIGRDYIVWGTDDASWRNRIMKAAKEDLSNPTVVHVIEEPVFVTHQIGNTIFMATQLGGGNYLANKNRVSEILASEDFGETWRTIVRWPCTHEDTGAGWRYGFGPDFQGGVWFTTIKNRLLGHTGTGNANSLRIGFDDRFPVNVYSIW